MNTDPRCLADSAEAQPHEEHDVEMLYAIGDPHPIALVCSCGWRQSVQC